MSVITEIRRAIDDTFGPIVTALTKPQGTPQMESHLPPQQMYQRAPQADPQQGYQQDGEGRFGIISRIARRILQGENHILGNIFGLNIVPSGVTHEGTKQATQPTHTPVPPYRQDCTPALPYPSRADVARMLTMNKYYLDDQRLDFVYQWVVKNNIQSESTIFGFVDGVFFPAVRRTR